MNNIIVDYRPEMCGLSSITVYETNGIAAINKYSLPNNWEEFKDTLTNLCYAQEVFDVIFYGNKNTIPFTEEELKQEFQSYEHKKYSNAANLNIHIELC